MRALRQQECKSKRKLIRRLLSLELFDVEPHLGLLTSVLCYIEADAFFFLLPDRTPSCDSVREAYTLNEH